MIHTPWLKLFRIEAITLWKWVLYASPTPDPILINHERIHLDQIKRDGVIKFYFRYLKDYFRLRCMGFGHYLAYRTIPYEVEAFTHQEDMEYKV